MSEKLIRTDGVEIATQAFGNPADEPVLLVMGVMASMLWWPDEFCERLAAQGRYVIRYDNRDTGLSTTYAPGEAPYSFDDMTDDAGRVLDAYGIAAAHIVGMSMGGMIAQRLALRRPERVRTLTIIDSTPIFFDVSHLPGTTPEYMKHSDSGASVDWNDRAQVIDFIVRDVKAIAGTPFPHDAAAARAFIERDYDRAKNFASVTNHFSAAAGIDLSGRKIGMPLLVIHGSVDPIFPVEHGEALAASASDAKMVRIEGGGHEMHPGHWDLIIGEIGRHTAGAA